MVLGDEFFIFDHTAIDASMQEWFSTMAGDALRFRPGMVYVRGKLFEFTKSRVTVRTSGPQPPRAWRKNTSGPWREIRPGIERRALAMSIRQSNADGRRQAGQPDGTGQYPLLRDWGERSRLFGRQAYLAWLCSLEVQQRIAVRPFRSRHWHLLQLAASCSEALQLMATNPALAFALASNWVFREPRRVSRALDSALVLLGQRQRHLAAWLDFPGTASTARILRRVPAAEVRLDMLLCLRGVLQCREARKRLAHVHTLNRGVVRIASDAELSACVSQRMLLEIGQPGIDSADLINTLLELLYMFRRLQPRGREKPARLLSIAQLEAMHTEMRYDLHALLEEQPIDPAEFPEPPLPGTRAIVPLSTPLMLWQEGEAQHNCAGSYAGRIAQSATRSDGRVPQVYLYRILAPQRATLAVVPQRNGWHIEQLAAACNRPVRPATRRMVFRWLEACNTAGCATRDGVGP